MKMRPYSVKVDSGRAHFPLHDGIKDFLLQSNESCPPIKKTMLSLLFWNDMRFFKEHFNLVYEKVLEPAIKR